jgi:hypothetical protein
LAWSRYCEKNVLAPRSRAENVFGSTSCSNPMPLTG